MVSKEDTLGVDKKLFYPLKPLIVRRQLSIMPPLLKSKETVIEKNRVLKSSPFFNKNRPG